MLFRSGGIAGAFLAQNLLLFFLLYEIELVPLYLLIAIWGGDDKRSYSAMKFLIYTALSGALMLAGFLRSEEHTSELQSLTNLVCRLLLEKKKQLCRILK